MKGRMVPSAERYDAEQAGPAGLDGVDLEGGRDNGEVAQHRAAHQADAGEHRDVGETLLPARDEAAHVSEAKPDDDGDRRAVDPPGREPA